MQLIKFLFLNILSILKYYIFNYLVLFLQFNEYPVSSGYTNASAKDNNV